jgi:hypothetical protein
MITVICAAATGFVLAALGPPRTARAGVPELRTDAAAVLDRAA